MVMVTLMAERVWNPFSPKFNSNVNYLVRLNFVTCEQSITFRQSKNDFCFCSFQVQLRKGYGIPDLKLDIAAQYMKAGVKNIGTVFLMTDAQVSDEKFLVLINDLLASGEIPDLFPDDEVENIIGGKWFQVI